jgi:desulfoferrodoxin (superoxide reductase-like protein)
MTCLTPTQNRTLHRGSLYLLALAAICLLAVPATAHAPTDMTIAFDPNTAKISVAITHPVPDPAAHYIKTVRVKLNDRVISDPDYKSQPTKDTFTYTYDVNAHPGDTIRVTAICSIAGSLEKTYEVPEPVRAVTTLPQDPIRSPAPSVPPTRKASAGLVALLGILGAVVALRR